VGAKADLQPVKYSSDKTCESYKKVLDLFVENGAPFDDVEFSNLFTPAWTSSITYKNPSFRAENETRLCAFPFGLNGISPEKIQYVITASGIKEFFAIELDDGSRMKDLIEEIILGPKASLDKNVFWRYLQKICGGNNIEFRDWKIEESDCPLI